MTLVFAPPRFRAERPPPWAARQGWRFLLGVHHHPPTTTTRNVQCEQTALREPHRTVRIPIRSNAYKTLRVNAARLRAIGCCVKDRPQECIRNLQSSSADQLSRDSNRHQRDRRCAAHQGHKLLEVNDRIAVLVCIPEQRPCSVCSAVDFLHAVSLQDVLKLLH